MSGKIRLARARGSLQAPNTPVQDRALDFLGLLDYEDRVDSIAVEMVSRNVDPRLYFPFLGTPTHQPRSDQPQPEYLRPEEDPFADALRPDGTYDIDRIDTSKVEWSVPDPEEDQELSRWISEHEVAVSVTDSKLTQWQ